MNLMPSRSAVEVPALAGPLYLQVAEHMRGRVKADEWPPNLSLPNEGDLAAHYRVSLGTMRKALEHLVRQKLVVRLQGRGTFVTKNNSKSLNSLYFFKQEAALWETATIEPKIQFLSSEKAIATSLEASLLKTSIGAIVERVTIITRLGDGTKSLDTIVLPEASIPSEIAHDWIDSKNLLTILADLIRSAIEYQDDVEPTVASLKAAKSLEIPTGTPLLSIVRQACSEAGNIPVILLRLMLVQKQVRYSVGLAA